MIENHEKAWQGLLSELFREGGMQAMALMVEDEREVPNKLFFGLANNRIIGLMKITGLNAVSLLLSAA